MKKLLIIILASIFLISVVSAWAPSTHYQLTEDLFNNSNSKIIEQCQPYKDAFLLGAVAPDITVIYYYSEGGKEYKLTHNWNFADEVMQQARTQDEICFAYGIASHLIADSVSHNMAVPDSIKKTKIPNWVLHPLLEQKYDSVIRSQDKTLADRTSHMMDALKTSRGERYINMMQVALGENTGIDVKSEMYKLALSLDSKDFYDEQYAPSGGTIIFKLYPYVADFTELIYPIVGNIRAGDISRYYDRTEELMMNSYSNWGSRYQVSPHGFFALAEADQTAKLFNWVYLIIALGIPLGISIWRKNWKYMLLIPAIIILEIVIVYMLL